MTATKPKRSEWTTWRRFKNDVIYGLAVAAMWLVGLLPTSLGQRIGAGVGWLGWLIARSEREKAVEHLAIAFPSMELTERRRLARRCFLSLGRRAAEICRMPRLDIKEYVHFDPDDKAQIEDTLAQGRGLLWVTAHFGNWELLAAGLAAQGWDVRPVAKQSYDSRFTDMIDRWRRRQGVVTLWRGRDDIAAGVAEALGQGAIVGLLIDQDTTARGVFVPFFGKQAWTPSGAAELARQTGSPLLVGFISRRPGGGHQIRVEAPSLSFDGTEREVDQRNTALLTACIEATVAREPEEWVWMHSRWKTRPGAEKRLKNGEYEQGIVNGSDHISVSDSARMRS